MSGQEMGQHIASLVPSGNIAVFVATPGSLNIQPRLDGVQDTLKSHPVDQDEGRRHRRRADPGAVGGRLVRGREPEL